MIGPVGKITVGAVHPVRLCPSGIEVPAEPRAKDALLAGSTPPVEASRVAELRGAIAEGRYAADPRAIAAAMVRDMTKD